MSALSGPRRSSATPTRIAVEAAAARSVDFMEAIIAAGALMAYADGEMAAAERRRLLQMVRETPMLASFSHREIARELAEHEANFHYDPEVAQLMAREKLVPLAGNARLALLVVDAGRRLIAADGVAHPAEYRALAEITDALGLAETADAGRLPAAGFERRLASPAVSR